MRRVIAAGESHGEAFWELPLVEEYRDSLKTPYADINNIAAAGVAGAITAALFLREFVPEGVAWAHLDIAGPMFRDRDWRYYEAGALGFGVKTLVHLWSASVILSPERVSFDRVTELVWLGSRIGSLDDFQRLRAEGIRPAST